MADHNRGLSRTWADEQLPLAADDAARALPVYRTALFTLIKNGEPHAGPRRAQLPPGRR